MKNRIIAILLAAIVFSGCIYNNAMASAVNNNAADPLITADAESGENDVFPGTPLRVTMTVLADGVRLRDWPSSNGTILELMYRGESVLVINLGNTWSKVKRIQTGTYGYCKTQYIG